MNWADAWPVIAGVVAAIGYWLRQRATARLEGEKRLRLEAESRALMAEADAQTKIAQAKADVEIRLSVAKEDAEERAFIRAQLQGQLNLNEQFQKLLIEKEKKDEGNYRVLANVQRDTNMVLVNILNRIEQQHAVEIAAIGGIPAAIQRSNADMLKEYAQLVGAEIGAAMAREFAMKNAERTMYPFPDAEDKRWRDDFILPLAPDVHIYKEPHFDDDARLRKSCSKINPAGEAVRLIEEASINAIAVYKIEDGVPCYGWLYAPFVRIGEGAGEYAGATGRTHPAE